MEKNQIKDLYEKYVISCYTKQDLVFVKGKGSYIWTSDGEKYLDFFPGWAVSGLGHCYPEIVKAIKKQAETLIHIPNNYYHPWQGILAKEIVDISFDGKLFFCNSGAEANEAAIKLCRLYGKKKKYKIISMENSFHGRTLATVTLTGQKKYNEPFTPLPEGFDYVPFNDFEALKKKVDDKTVAVFIEIIQGEGGINVIDRGYLQSVNNLCKEKDILLVFDEVQTGFGRTGKFFAYQHFGIEPDIMTLAKTLGGGFPIGAMIAKKEIADYLVPGTHASTFGGSPLACASAIAVIKTIKEKNLLERVEKYGKYLRGKLEKLKEKYRIIKRIKGLGLMLAIELEIDGSEFYKLCLDKKLLLNCTHGNIIRVMPSLTVKKKEIDEAVEIMDECFSHLSL